jgi:solute carrier family 25 carnitine/acylcarnitine transporter 20/29
MLQRLFKPDASLEQPNPKCPTYGFLISGGIAGAAAWVVTDPIDIVKTRIQVAQAGGGGDVSKYQRHRFIPDGGMINALKHTYRSEGHAGLWRGIGPCVSRALAVNSIAFWVWEFTAQTLRSYSASHDDDDDDDDDAEGATF